MISVPNSRSRAPATRLIVLSSIAAAAAVLGCESAAPDLETPIDAETYVIVMSELADLQRFPPPGPDEESRAARADSARQTILDRHGVTVDELLAFAEIVGAHPRRMQELGERIVALTDTLAHRRGTAAAQPAKPPAPGAWAAESAAFSEPDDAAIYPAAEYATDAGNPPAAVSPSDTAAAADTTAATPERKLPLVNPRRRSRADGPSTRPNAGPRTSPSPSPSPIRPRGS